MAERFTNPVPQFFDNAGAPLLSGLMDFFENGSETIRKDTFADVNLTIKNENPVPLSGDGRLPNVFFNGTARAVLRDDTGQIWAKNGVGQFGSGSAFDTWSSIVEYENQALVVGSDGAYYRSIQNDNLGNDPISSPSFWEKVSFLRTWNANITYDLGDGGVVASDGKIYRSLQAANLNKDPISEPTWWSVTNPFDQDLNTTNSVEFVDGTFTGDVTTSGKVIVNDTTDSTSVLAGSLQTDGGAGIAKKLYVGDSATFGGLVVLSTGQQVYFDGGGNTFIDSPTGTNLRFSSNGASTYMTLNSIGDLDVSKGINAGGDITASSASNVIKSEGDASTNGSFVVGGGSGIIDRWKIGGQASVDLLFTDMRTATDVMSLRYNTGLVTVFFDLQVDGNILGTQLRSASGVTGSRPTPSGIGARWFDTTLGIPIWHDGTNWVDATGATV